MAKTKGGKVTQEEKIRRINNLKEKIDKINHFLHVVDSTKNIQRGSGSWDIDCLMKVYRRTSYLLFGRRWLGFSSDTKEEIQVPNEVIEEIEIAVYKKLHVLKEELNELV